MTEDDAPAQEQRLDDWPLRPWLLAALLGVAALLAHLVSDGAETEAWRLALAAALAFGPLALAFTLDVGRWKAPAVFSALVALIMAGIAWRAAHAGERHGDEQFWVAAGILSIALAVPLFQAGFHRLRWKTAYKTTHFHVWTDAISGAGALAFVGLAWALLFLLAELFATIRIAALRDLISEDWFGWTFSGAAFGAALGVLRNQLRIIGTLQNVVLVVLSILAVPLAAALVVFLLAVAVSGMNVLWEATRSATPLLLAIAVGCFILANAVVRDEDAQASTSSLLRLAGFVLALGILPLTGMAAVSMGTRIAQHGLSPERLWALVAIAVALAYGLAYFVAALRGRRAGWRELLRRANLHLAVVTCAIAFLLALPVFDFGTVAARNQVARLERGAVSADEFDYAALRWEFGDAGRRALARLASSKDPEVAKLAAAMQAQKVRPYGPVTPEERVAIAEQARIEVSSPRIAAALRDYLGTEVHACREGCRLVEVGTVEQGVLVALVSQRDTMLLVFEEASGKVAQYWQRNGRLVAAEPSAPAERSEEGRVELRPFEGRQLFVDGQPVGEPFR